MKVLFCLLAVGLFLSCSKNEEDSFVVATSIDISLKDSEGNDLLDPIDSVSYGHDDIKLFYVLEGRKVEVFDGNMDQPKGFLIYKHEDEHRVRIFPNVDGNEEYPVTIIQWKEDEKDTIKCEIKNGPNMKTFEKVWLNNELVLKTNEERLLRITK